MSRLDDVRAAIVEAMRTVPNMGQVHDRERYDKGDEEAFRRLYVVELEDGTEQLRGWWLRRAKAEESSINTVRTVEILTWQIRGFMAFNDEQASELVFDGLVETFRDLVRADPTLGGVCELGPLSSGGDSTDGVQVMDAGPVLFCGVLCHSATLSLRTWSYL